MTNLNGRREERIMKYIAKSRHEGIAIAKDTFEGFYEIVLNPGWVWDDESTTFFSYDVATLRKDQQRIKFDIESWEGLTGRNYEDAINGLEELNAGKIEEVEEVDTVKYENLYFTYYDIASDTYELEFHTDDGDMEFIKVDAGDHPEASINENYFDDKEVVDLIIMEMT